MSAKFNLTSHVVATDGQERSGLKLGSCSTGINRFNRKRFRLTQLTFSNGTLSQPFSVEKRSLLGRVITRLPRNLPVVDPKGKHDGCSPCSCSLFFFSDVLEEDVVKNESRDELRRCHLSCLQGESNKQYRLHN